MVRAKFLCVSVKRDVGTPNVGTIVLRPVYGGDSASDENKKFWQYTPSGEISLSCLNESATAFYEVGKEYYVDFSRATA